MEERFKYLVVTHFYADGPAQYLCRYLGKRYINYIVVEHPFIYAKRSYSDYKINYGEKKREIKGRIRKCKNDLVFWIEDLISTIFFCLNRKIDIGIGFDNLNALSLIFLKVLGRIKKVVYVTVDYTPVRFKNKLLNYIYHEIDKFCCYHADLLWDSSERMKIARKNMGVNIRRMKPVIVVSDGNNFEKDKIKKVNQINGYKMVYMGHVRENQGIKLLIDCIGDLRRWNKKISLLIIGGGDKLDYYKKYAKEKGISRIATFTGYIEDHEKVQELLKKCYLSFALYEDDPESFSRYSAVGKPLVYMGCGLPVIITDVPEIAEKIKKEGAGKIVKYDREEIVDTVKEIIQKESVYMEMRKTAINYAQKNTWDKVFHLALNKTYKILYK